MSVLIKNQTKPKGCGVCNFWSICDRWKNRNWGMKPPEDCPIDDVPPHGRLIDADALCELCNIMADKCDGVGESIWNQFRTTVEWTPTVIPADGKDTNVPIKEEGE